jgi:hypothetical protein
MEIVMVKRLFIFASYDKDNIIDATLLHYLRALSELGETMAANITTKGVSASASDGLTTLAGKILQITGGGGSTIIYQPSLDGTETLYQIGGTTTVANGEMSGGTCYLTQGWDNTIDWELTFEAYYVDRDGESIQLSFGNPTRADYNCIRFLCPAYNSIQTNKQSTVYNDGSLNSVTQSTWLSFNVKRVGNTMTVKIGNNTSTTHNYRFSEYDTVCIGTNSWDGTAKIRNIVVKTVGGSGGDCSQYTTQINNAIEYINGDGS